MILILIKVQIVKIVFIFADNVIISKQEAAEPSPEPTARETEAETDVTETEITKPEVKPIPFEPPRLKKGIIALWRARCITPYNPDLLPPEPVPLQEEVRAYMINLLALENLLKKMISAKKSFSMIKFF